MKITQSKVLLLAIILFVSNMWLFKDKFIAAPVSDRVIKNVEVVDDIHRSQVTINFSFPLRYESHFPIGKGQEIRINFRPLTISRLDLDALFRRESVFPQQTDLVPLERVTFESEFIDNPSTGLGGFSEPEARRREQQLNREKDFYVMLSFAQNVAFGVYQGKDFRSIIVYVCEKEFSRELQRCADY